MQPLQPRQNVFVSNIIAGVGRDALLVRTFLEKFNVKKVANNDNIDNIIAKPPAATTF